MRPDPGERLARRLARHISDPRVLRAVAAVPRDRFVPESERADAWRNAPLPIGAGQTISQPLVVAHMCELLALEGDERVLDVGTGSGYHAAVLAQLADHVWSIERHAELLSRQAADNLADSGIENVTLLVGDGSRGHADAAPYDAINVGAASPAAALTRLEGQLAAGGRLVAPLAGPEQRLAVVRREPDGGVSRRLHEPVRFVPLVSDEDA